MYANIIKILKLIYFYVTKALLYFPFNFPFISEL